MECASTVHEALNNIQDNEPCFLEMTMVFKLEFVEEFEQAMNEYANYYTEN